MTNALCISIELMKDAIIATLVGNNPTIYLYGSIVHDDFKLGASDIDIIVLTEYEITEVQANALVKLRQTMLAQYPSNPYFRLFEGGMLSTDAFLQGKNERTVYWGTSGQRITDSYNLDSFAVVELLERGILLCGGDIRAKMQPPSYTQMRDEIRQHVQTARLHGKTTGWLLDIARGIYTLRTGKVIPKTAAGEWAIKNNLCPNADAMYKAVEIRKTPQAHPNRDMDASIIQQFCDVIDAEFDKGDLPQ